MSFWGVGLLLAVCIVSVTADVIKVVDFITAGKANESAPAASNHSISRRSTGYVSGYGMFKHWSSGKYVHLWWGPKCPRNYVDLVIHRGYNNDGRMSYRFVQAIGHYGYLQHTCGKYVHPYGGWSNPGQNTPVSVHSARHAGALWTIDGDGVIHRSGKVWHPKGGSSHPWDNTNVVVHSGRKYATMFKFVNPRTLKPMPVFPTPKLQGRWKVIWSIHKPRGTHTYEISYTVGKSVTKSVSRSYSWEVSATVAYGWFEGSSTFGMAAERSEETTWNRETTRTWSVEVKPGQSVATWQYFFTAEQFGEGVQFRSTILADTEGVHKLPSVPGIK